MPVILDTPSEIALWLGISPSSASSSSSSSNSFTPAVARLLRPYQRSLACYKVPREVGKVGNDSPGFIQPVAGRKDGIQAFFGKQQRAQAKAQTEESSGKRSQDETQFRQSDPEEGKEGKKDAASPNANESGAKGNSTPESSLGAQDLAHANAREKADALELTEQTEVEVQYEAKAEADTSDELVTATASAEAEAQAQARAAYMDMYEQDRDQEEERQGKERRAQIEADHAFAMRLAHGDDADGDGEGDERSQGQGKGPARTEKETEVAVPAREVGDGFGTPAPAPDASSTTSTDENANKRHAPSGASAVPEWARAESGRREGRAGEEEQGGRAPRPTKRARHGSSPDVSSYVHAQEGKEANEEGASASSKFSPEPFNPPISPPRPSGGYTSGSGSGSGSNPVRAHAHAHAEDKDGDGAERRSPGKGKGKGGAGNSTGTRGAGKATSGRSAGAKARTKEKDLEKAAQGVPDIRRFFGS